jgi:putative sterol carrier protein
MRYLSLDWIDAMQAQVAASESLADLASTHSIGVTQVVTDGPEGSVLYHFQVGNGIARFASGPAPDEDIRMEQTWETAVGVATGSLPAQEAFIKGHVRISGDTQRIVDTVPVFAALDAAFEAVRALTTYE